MCMFGSCASCADPVAQLQPPAPRVVSAVLPGPAAHSIPCRYCMRHRCSSADIRGARLRPSAHHFHKERVHLTLLQTAHPAADQLCHSRSPAWQTPPPSSTTATTVQSCLPLYGYGPLLPSNCATPALQALNLNLLHNIYYKRPSLTVLARASCSRCSARARSQPAAQPHPAAPPRPPAPTAAPCCCQRTSPSPRGGPPGC